MLLADRQLVLPTMCPFTESAWATLSRAAARCRRLMHVSSANVQQQSPTQSPTTINTPGTLAGENWTPATSETAVELSGGGGREGCQLRTASGAKGKGGGGGDGSGEKGHGGGGGEGSGEPGVGGGGNSAGGSDIATARRSSTGGLDRRRRDWAPERAEVLLKKQTSSRALQLGSIRP